MPAFQPNLSVSIPVQNFNQQQQHLAPPTSVPLAPPPNLSPRPNSAGECAGRAFMNASSRTVLFHAAGGMANGGVGAVNGYQPAASPHHAHPQQRPSPTPPRHSPPQQQPRPSLRVLIPPSSQSLTGVHDAGVSKSPLNLPTISCVILAGVIYYFSPISFSLEKERVQRNCEMPL